MRYHYIDLHPTKCNVCGGQVELVPLSKVVNGQARNGSDRWCYHCVSCGARVGTHKPHPDVAMGVLSNEEGRKKKIACHKLFDVLWENEPNTYAARKMAYQELASRLKIPLSACHFGYFDNEQLDIVYEVLRKMQAERTFMDEYLIKNLQSAETEIGTLIDAQKYLLSKISPCVSRDGVFGWYEAVFEDKSGKINGKLWREAGMELNQSQIRAMVGKVVEVNGVLREYNGKKEINVTRMNAAEEYDLEDYVRTLSSDDLFTLKKRVLGAIGSIQDANLRTLAETIFRGTILERFCTLPANLKNHHNYNGGLLTWSLEILDAALAISTSLRKFHSVKEYPVAEINDDLLIAGALLSGLGKLSAYEMVPINVEKKRGHLVNYTTDSLMFVTMYINKLPPEKRMLDTSELAHVILSSSGDIVPKTKEAMIIASATRMVELLDSYDVAVENAYNYDDCMLYNSYMDVPKANKIFKNKEEVVYATS